jgi:hypothetical protein
MEVHMFKESSTCGGGECVQVEWGQSTTCSGGECVQVGFHKATASNNNGSCVEAAICDCGVRVRDSKDQDGPVLTFTKQEWAAFTEGVRAGEFEVT